MNSQNSSANALALPDRLLGRLPAGFTEFAGRSLLALIFILAGYSKIGGYDANLAYMASVGVPGFLLPALVSASILTMLARRALREATVVPACALLIKSRQRVKR